MTLFILLYLKEMDFLYLFTLTGKKLCHRTDHRSLVSRNSDAKTFVNGKVDVGSCIRQTLGNTQWEKLELYLVSTKYLQH